MFTFLSIDPPLLVRIGFKKLYKKFIYTPLQQFFVNTYYSISYFTKLLRTSKKNIAEIHKIFQVLGTLANLYLNMVTLKS